MHMPRRFLPSVSSLLALEAVDRLGSASAAAAELNLTHSAVSRQLKVLEEQLGTRLVQREGTRLALTPAAQDYCQKVRRYLRDLAQASLELKANPSGGGLNLAILPAFGMHWLAPRLRDFARAHPEVTVNLSSRLAPFEFSRESFDAAIHFGQRSWQGVDYLELAPEKVVPVCSPRLAPEPLARAEELLELPLLHLETRPGAWDEWFAAHGVAASSVPGMLIDQFSTMMQAALHDLGVALLPSFLAEEELRRKALVVPFGDPVAIGGHYYLVWPSDAPMKPPLAKFLGWLRSIL
ncbi:MAG: LysR family transcriptional regulator [Roseovarius sp.]